MMLFLQLQNVGAVLTAYFCSLSKTICIPREEFLGKKYPNKWQNGPSCRQKRIQHVIPQRRKDFNTNCPRSSPQNQSWSQEAILQDG